MGCGSFGRECGSRAVFSAGIGAVIDGARGAPR